MWESLLLALVQFMGPFGEVAGPLFTGWKRLNGGVQRQCRVRRIPPGGADGTPGDRHPGAVPKRTSRPGSERIFMRHATRRGSETGGRKVSRGSQCESDCDSGETGWDLRQKVPTPVHLPKARRGRKCRSREGGYPGHSEPSWCRPPYGTNEGQRSDAHDAHEACPAGGRSICSVVNSSWLGT